ncbi:MAG: FKBP-type peptidyl-prolyl cis-trans isomerase [Nitrospiraceae bacterium]|nr:MAG: FKBP-type peptidyl-prolyl cis-trans isomerase [Nitrospiraceae bacterium]
MKKIITTIISFVLLHGFCFAQENPDLNQEKDRVSYSIGFQIGGDFKKQGMDIDPDALLKGIEDALSSAEPQLSPEEMKSTLLEMKNKIEAGQRQQKQAAVEQYRGEGREFLAENAKKEGVVVLPSGLQYKVIAEGTGKTPQANDTVSVHYRGTLIDGREFYNSRRGKETPESFHVGAVVRGMSEALQLMKEGAKWKLFVPADLAYGEHGPVGERAVIFDIELISIKPSE